jgi:zinc protease
MLDRKIAPDFVKPQIFTLPQANKKTLSSGIPYLEVLSGSQPALKVEIYFKAGQLLETSEGLAFFTSKLLTAGTTRHSAKEIEEVFASYGAFIETFSGQDHSGLQVYCLPKHLNPVLHLLKHLLTESVFPENEIESLRQIQLQHLKVNLEKTSYLATVNFRQKFFGNHPYSRSLNAESLNKVTRADIQQFFQHYFCLSNSAIFVSGGGAESFYDDFDQIFNIQEEKNIVGESGSGSILYGKGSLHIEKSGALQASLRLGVPTIGLSDYRYSRLSLLNEILGGYFGSRLMKNIREDKGYTYGIHSSLVSFAEASYLVVGTDVRSEVRGETIAEINKEIRILQTEAVTEDELETVKNYMLGSFLNSINTPFSIMERYKILYYHNLSFDYFDGHFLRLLNTSSEDLLQISNEFLKQEDFLIVTAG